MTDTRFGQLAVARGMITRAQLDAALAKQKQSRSDNPKRFARVGYLLVKAGHLTNRQVVELLAEQGIGIVRCEKSQRQFNVVGVDKARRYLSPVDSEPMVHVEPGSVKSILVASDMGGGPKKGQKVARVVAPKGTLSGAGQTPVAEPTPRVQHAPRRMGGVQARTRQPDAPRTKKSVKELSPEQRRRRNAAAHGRPPQPPTPGDSGPADESSLPPLESLPPLGTGGLAPMAGEPPYDDGEIEPADMLDMPELPALAEPSAPVSDAPSAAGPGEPLPLPPAAMARPESWTPGDPYAGMADAPPTAERVEPERERDVYADIVSAQSAPAAGGEDGPPLPPTMVSDVNLSPVQFNNLDDDEDRPSTLFDPNIPGNEPGSDASDVELPWSHGGPSYDAPPTLPGDTGSGSGVAGGADAVPPPPLPPQPQTGMVRAMPGGGSDGWGETNPGAPGSTAPPPMPWQGGSANDSEGAAPRPIWDATGESAPPPPGEPAPSADQQVGRMVDELGVNSLPPPPPPLPSGQVEEVPLLDADSPLLDGPPLPPSPALDRGTGQVRLPDVPVAGEGPTADQTSVVLPLHEDEADRKAADSILEIEEPPPTAAAPAELLEEPSTPQLNTGRVDFDPAGLAPPEAYPDPPESGLDFEIEEAPKPTEAMDFDELTALSPGGSPVSRVLKNEPETPAYNAESAAAELGPGSDEFHSPSSADDAGYPMPVGNVQEGYGESGLDADPFGVTGQDVPVEADDADAVPQPDAYPQAVDAVPAESWPDAPAVSDVDNAEEVAVEVADADDVDPPHALDATPQPAQSVPPGSPDAIDPVEVVEATPDELDGLEGAPMDSPPSPESLEMALPGIDDDDVSGLSLPDAGESTEGISRFQQFDSSELPSPDELDKLLGGGDDGTGADGDDLPLP